MRQIGDLLAGELRGLGIDAVIATSGVPGRGDDLDIVIAPHEYVVLEGIEPRDAVDVFGRCALVTTEQPGTVWFEAELGLCRESPAIVDVNPIAADWLAAHGLAAEALEVGHTPWWDVWGGADDERRLDITVMAAVTPHRADAISKLADVLAEWRSDVRLFDNSRPVVETDRWFIHGEALLAQLADTRVLLNVRRQPGAGYFEWVRCLPAVLNGALVVTEPSGGSAPLVAFEHFVAAPVEALGGYLTAILDDETLRRRLALDAYERLRSVPPLARSVERFVHRAADGLRREPRRIEPELHPSERRSGKSAGRDPVATSAPVPAVAQRIEIDPTGAVDLALLAATVSACASSTVFIDAPSTVFAPRGREVLVEALDADAVAAAYGVVAVHDPEAGVSTLADHLPWDPARLCASPFIAPPVLVRRDAFAHAVAEAAQLVDAHADTRSGERSGDVGDVDEVDPAWAFQLPFLVMAARGHRCVQVPAIVARSTRTATRTATDGVVPPAWFRSALPALPWPLLDANLEPREER
jgi:hypothetical protein